MVAQASRPVIRWTCKFPSRVSRYSWRGDCFASLDNYATHKTAAIHRWLVAHPRVHFHFTPTSASWINLVERRFATLTEKQLRRGSTRALVQTIKTYLATNNDHPKPFIWTKTADEILTTIARFCKRICNSGHEEEVILERLPWRRGKSNPRPRCGTMTDTAAWPNRDRFLTAVSLLNQDVVAWDYLLFPVPLTVTLPAR